MKDEKKYKIAGASLALLLHIGIGIAMYCLYLSSSVPDEPPLPVAKSEITFGGEYVQLGDMPLPDLTEGEAGAQTSDDEPATSGNDNVSEGNSGDGESLVTTTHDSPMTSEKRKNGPTEAEKKEQERIRLEKERQQQQRSDINSRTSNAFNKKGGGNSGSPDGNSETGNLQGVPGHDLGDNYRLIVQKPSCTKSGTIAVSIVVRRDGTIKEARYANGTGEAAADRNVRNQFVEFTKRLKFDVSGNAAAEKRGTITWRIKN